MAKPTQLPAQCLYLHPIHSADVDMNLIIGACDDYTHGSDHRKPLTAPATYHVRRCPSLSELDHEPL